MDNSRNSRKLGINSAIFNVAEGTTSIEVEKVVESTPSKSTLKTIFQAEIDELVSLEIQSQKEKLIKELQEKFEQQLQILEKEYRIKNKVMTEQENALSQLIDSITTKYQVQISDHITQLDGILIEIVMEVLYKILGEKDAYEKSVEKIIRAFVTKQSTNLKVSMRVSEESFYFLSKLYKDNAVINSIQIDNSLSVGQVRIDDGVSIVAAGLIDQLDFLKNVLIGQLRETHGL